MYKCYNKISAVSNLGPNLHESVELFLLPKSNCKISTHLFAHILMLGMWVGHIIASRCITFQCITLATTITRNKWCLLVLISPFASTHTGAAEVRSVNFTRLLSAGVLHTKLWLVDGRHFYIGSANMDWRSLTQVFLYFPMLLTACMMRRVFD